MPVKNPAHALSFVVVLAPVGWWANDWSCNGVRFGLQERAPDVEAGDVHVVPCGDGEEGACDADGSGWSVEVVVVAAWLLVSACDQAGFV